MHAKKAEEDIIFCRPPSLVAQHGTVIEGRTAGG